MAADLIMTHHVNPEIWNHLTQNSVSECKGCGSIDIKATCIYCGTPRRDQDCQPSATELLEVMCSDDIIHKTHKKHKKYYNIAMPKKMSPKEKLSKALTIFNTLKYGTSSSGPR